jgi:putative transcriptional regulator
MLHNDIKKYREARGLTQEQLAELVAMRQESLNRIETGKQDPQGATMLKIAKALGVTVERVFRLRKRDAA